MRGQAGFWDVDERYALLSEAGDPLVKLNEVVPWEVFRKPLAKALKRSDGAKGGRPPFDSVMMFKIMVLQALYDLSDDQAEFVINDRLSFLRFLGLGLGDKVPPSRRLQANDCRSTDATLVAAPKQRNSDGEKQAIKEDRTADEIWPDEPAKAAQKDTDARRTVKFSKAKPDADGMVRQRDIAVPSFGYKNHAAIDRHCGFIRGWNVTSASAHDGAQLRNVLNRENTGSKVWADTAYRSKKNEAWLERHGYESDIHHKKPKGRPMSEATSRANGRRSKVRAFVEHVFAHQKNRFGLFIRAIGIERARVKIGMANIAYNLTRYVWHQGRSAPA